MHEHSWLALLRQCALHRNTLNTVSGSMAHTAAHEHLWLLSTYVVRHTVRGMGAPAPPDVWASAFPMALPDALPRGTSMSPLRGGMRLREVLASRASPQKKAPVDRPLD